MKYFTYAKMVNSGASKLAELGVFCLPFHPVFEIRSVFFLVGAFGIAQVFTRSRNNNFRKRFQLPIGRRHYGPDDQSSSRKFLRRKSLIVVVHDVNVSLVRHPWFEYRRFGARKFKFELGLDDTCLDETSTCFTHEITVH